MKFKTCLVMWLICMSALSYAVEEVVVTPARYSQSVKEVVPSVIIINREMIERSPSLDIAGLLRWHAGLEIGRTGGIGQQTSVFIRGTNSNHSTVLINGIKMNSATTGGGALGMINTSVIERIEVVKGPRSTVYGSEAVGGVINIITADSELGRSADLRVTHGRYATNGQSMNLSYGNDRASADLSFSKLETGGFPARAESSSDHGHDNETFDVNIRAKAGAGELVFGFWQADGNTEYDSFGDLDQDRKNNILKAGLTLPVTENWLSTLSISRMKDEVRQNQANFLGNRDHAYTDRVVYDWENSFKLYDNVLVFGMSLAEEDTDSLSFGTSYREDTDIYSVYLNEQFVHDRHSLYTATRYTNHEDFDDAMTWNLEYGYSLADKTKLFASIGTGFRAPDSNARFGFGGNPGLKEETSRSIEAGIQYDMNAFSAISLRVFENKIDDLIETVAIDPEKFIYENRNVETARTRGLELTFSHQSGPWNLSLEGIIQNPRNETDDTRLLRRAKRTLTGYLAYTREKYFVQLNGLVTSERRDFGGVNMSGYGLIDISAGYHFPYVTLALKAENLFDKEYELAAGYNQPGQSIFAEFQFRPTL